jgi:16S rRNA (cytosine1402-N4)-methyltransferase
MIKIYDKIKKKTKRVNELEFNHTPVLLKECINGLNIKENGIYVDGTMGGAGHSLKIIENLSASGLLIGIDRDQEAISVAKERLNNFKNVQFVHDNHDNILNILENLEIEAVDGILLDLGVSSYQLDERNRGFSYMGDSTLDMRMDRTQKLDAKTVVNKYSEEDLANIIYEYGEERFSRQIARKICEARKEKEIETTSELVKIIESSVPRRPNEGHPAKRTFQAIRIEVNNELKPLYQTTIDCIKALKPGGRLCIITFHSLEDKMVKKAMADCIGKCTCPPGLPYCVCGAKSYGKIISKKPILPTEEEQKENSRSKSAKLRIFERNDLKF